MAKSKCISLEDAITAYNNAVKSGTGKDVVAAKRQLDLARQQNAEKETRTYDELMNLHVEAIKNDKLAEAMQYYYTAQAVKKKSSKSSKSFEEQVTDEVIKAMGEEIC